MKGIYTLLKFSWTFLISCLRGSYNIYSAFGANSVNKYRFSAKCTKKEQSTPRIDTFQSFFVGTLRGSTISKTE